MLCLHVRQMGGSWFFFPWLRFSAPSAEKHIDRHGGRLPPEPRKKNPLLLYARYNRKKRKTRFEANETRFRQWFDSFPVGLFITDRSGRLVRTNAAFREFIGYPERELSQKRFLDLIYPDDRERSTALFNELRQEKRDFYERESRYTRKNGSVVWGEKVVSTLNGEGETTNQVLGLVKDISARKPAGGNGVPHRGGSAARQTAEPDERQAQLSEQARENAVSEERHRLARELHDTVVQLLYSMSLLSDGWKQMAEQGNLPDPAASFQELENISLQALVEMRLMIHQLRQPVLDEVGLAGALRQRLEEVENRLNVLTELVIEGELPPLNQFMEEQLFDISREALNNALRHAQADAIYVGIRYRDGQLSMVIRDNGLGFDPNDRPQGIGIQSMHERAEAIAARLEILSAPGKGTTIEVMVSI